MNTQENIGHDVARRLVKLAIAVIGLLIIRWVLDSLPMFKGGEGDYDPTRIAPVSIFNAILDTLVFAALIWTASGFNHLIRSASKRLPEGGLMILLLIIILVVALAYHSYMGVIFPLLGSEANWYGWFFLALGLLPLLGLIVVASRNLDALTEVVFSSAKRAKAIAAQHAVSQPRGGTASAAISSPIASPGIICSKCGASIATGVKFCGSCGTPAPAPASPTQKLCATCGAKNESGAKFCKGCGKPLI